MSAIDGLPQLLYVTDPLCPWCYGFTPVVRRLRAIFQRKLEVQVVLGGLNPYAREPLSRKQREALAVLWHQVQQQTGLPFNYHFFTRPDLVFDTEPACRALLAVRLLRPKLTLEVLRAFHTAFHADNLDLSLPDVLAGLVETFGISENLFLTLYEAEEVQEQLEDEFGFVQEMGNHTLPSLYLQSPQGPVLLSQGYCPLEKLEPFVWGALRDHYPQPGRPLLLP